MHLIRITCRDFRCLTQVDFPPGPGLNIIEGDNAQGKTSLLEAILFAAISKSHRARQDADLARQGADGFRLAATAQRINRSITIETIWHKGIKRVKVNDVPQTRLSDLLGKIALVLFSPEDIVLVKGGAAHRRRFLDMALSQIDPAYLAALQRYRQALRQRNEVLRKNAADPAYLGVWDAQMGPSGALVIERRQAFIAGLAAHAAQAYARIAGDEPLSIAYAPNVPPGEAIDAVLARTRESDIRRRVTTRGPHLDDFTFTINGQSAREFASQGQQKSAALAVKLAELELGHEQLGEYPVLLLDEVLAELDEQRAHRLFSALPSGVQCVATTTVRAAHDRISPPGTPRFRIQRGHLERTS